jgi:ribosomal-protein-alanine N-acetyltransferase
MTPIFPTLYTEHLILREIVASDANALFQIHSDAETMRWFGVDPITDIAQANQITAMFAGWFTGGTGVRWGIERRSDARLIGTCGFFRWNKSWRNCLLGFELARDATGQGYMTAALRAVLAHGFGPMGLHRIQAESHADNHASIAVLTRLGFRFEGTHREQAFWGGRFHDLNCYALLGPEWRQ